MSVEIQDQTADEEDRFKVVIEADESIVDKSAEGQPNTSV